MYITHLSTELGQHRIYQEDLADHLRTRFNDDEFWTEARRQTTFVYDRSGIKQRYWERWNPDALNELGWEKHVNQAVFDLTERCLLKMKNGGWRPENSGALIVVSSTYQGFPSLSRRVAIRMGFDPDAVCFDLAGLGCAGPTHALYLAHLLMADDKYDEVTVVCVDAMGSYGGCAWFMKPPDVSQIVAHALSSDAASSMVLRRNEKSESRSWKNASLKSHMWPNTLVDNDLAVDDSGSPFISVGNGIRHHVGDEVPSSLKKWMQEGAVLFHPGGRALMDTLSGRCPEHAKSLELSKSVLDDVGNVGAASLCLVLERALDAKMIQENRLGLFALGPGIISTLLILDGWHS